VANTNHRDRAQERRILELYDLLEDGADLEAVLAAEIDPQVRQKTRSLWEHHIAAQAEQFLEHEVEFEMPPVFAAGDLLLGRFQIERLIGRGGMGEVYSAFDKTAQERVALKTITGILAPVETVRRQFVAEVQNARKVTHPNVCRIHEIFESKETPFFVMEYVSGKPLNKLIADQSLSRKALRAIAFQLADGLAAAHRRGVIHGDFKPQNVLVVDSPVLRPVITDFGLARAMARTPESEMASDPIVGGTRQYMAPELFAGNLPTVSTDIFAFGQVARQLLPANRLWARCVKPNPNDRPKTLDELLNRLRAPNRRWALGAIATLAGGGVFALLKKQEPLVRLENASRVLINGFSSSSVDVQVLKLARSLLITALRQSSRIQAVSDQDLLPNMERLRPGQTLPIAGDLLHQLLKLERAQYWLEGALSQSNARHSLALRVLRATDGALLTEGMFADEPSLASIAAKAGVWVRTLAGESAASLAANSSVVTDFTSKVPEALLAYYQALEHTSMGDADGAIPSVTEAIRLDPNFAQAHLILAFSLNSQMRLGEAFEEFEKAHLLSRRLPERERAWVDAAYSREIDDPEAMIQAGLRNTEFFPDEPRYYRQLAQALCRSGKPQESIPHIRKAVSLMPSDSLIVADSIFNLTEAGLVDEAMQEYQRSKTAGQHNTYLDYAAGFSLLCQNRYADSDPLLQQLPDDDDLYFAALKLMTGRLTSVIADLQQRLAASVDQKIEADAFQTREFLCGCYWLTDRRSNVRSLIADMVAVPPLPPFLVYLQDAASWARRLGEPAALDQASAKVKAIDQRWPTSLTRSVLAHFGGLEAWQNGDLDRAVASFRTAMGLAHNLGTTFELATCYSASATWDLADESWHRFESRASSVLRWGSPWTILAAWIGSAQVAAALGDKQRASQQARKILDRWAGTNPKLTIVAQAKSFAISTNK